MYKTYRFGCLRMMFDGKQLKYALHPFRGHPPEDSEPRLPIGGTTVIETRKPTQLIAPST